MSKRNYRSLAVVAGAALALGSMAPAMAARATADAEAEVDLGIITELTGELPELPEISIPTTGQLLFAGGFVLNGANTLLGTTFTGLTGVVGALPDGGDCALVAVASCNAIDARIPVNASGLNVLGGGILNNSDVDAGVFAPVVGGGILNNGGDLGVGVVAPVVAGVVAPINGNVMAPITTDVSNVLSGGLLGGLGSILNVDADANVLAGVLAFL